MNFEAHITLPIEFAAAVEAWAAENAAAWKFSKIDGDPLLGAKPHCYLTRHHTQYDWLLSNMRYVVTGLMDREGIPTLRQKVELIMYDTKTDVGLV